MRFQRIDNAQPQTFQPVTISITLETPDDLRWFYHLMNFQAQEIAKGYQGNRRGDFEDRFVDFEVPDKKDLYRAIKAEAEAQNVAIHK